MQWYIATIILVIIIYASLYYIFEDELIIYQTNLAHFDFNLLYKKQPIIIEDNVKDINQLLNTWFNINIVNDNINVNSIWSRNKYKYLLIQSFNPIEVTICNASSKIIYGAPDINTNMTTIKLNNNKIIILPFKWYYHIEGNAYIYGIHDYITYMIGNITK